MKALSDFVYQVEDLRNGQLDDVHASRLKLYRDSEIEKDAIMSHVIHSETGMVVSRLLGLEETPDGIYVQILWEGLDNKE